MYNLQDYHYELPEENIASSPAVRRDHSRLLVLDKTSASVEHRQFFDIIDYLRAGDVLVMNNSKVIPARLIGRKAGSGGKVEVFLHRQAKAKDKTVRTDTPTTTNIGRDALPGRLPTKKTSQVKWECLIGAKNIKAGQIIEFSDELSAEVIRNNEDGTWLIAFNQAEPKFMELVERIGQVPLPPYIEKLRPEKKASVSDTENYQTVYADDEKRGSVAAPTAGLHFTPELMERIRAKGVSIEFVTLYVGLGTFAPVKTSDIREHEMHSEYVEIGAETLARIIAAKAKGARVIAVGTTSARTLESLAEKIEIKEKDFSFEANKVNNTDLSFWTNIFIYPGYKFTLVDAMITNFHLPESSLIMLVAALAGRENIMRAYGEAIKDGYRFYSYGDAMLIF